MKILVTGGLGYVGSVLVPLLIASGHEVDIVDLGWFGNHTGRPVPARNFLSLTVEDIKADAIIHLAAVANDPTGDLDPRITWETNALATMRLADMAVRAGVNQFIYASSGSVYGVSDDPQVTEESELNPVSAYNKTKMVAERCLLSYSDKMAVQILRPATVCGLSPRMRLDVAVNMLTMQALTKKEITLHGGAQYRPNVHIQDMAAAYLWMLRCRHLTGIYNVGFENIPLIDLAERISKRTKASIEIADVTDKRSYRMNSDKLLATGFKPKHSVNQAIADLCIAYKGGNLVDKDEWHNLRMMKKNAIH